MITCSFGHGTPTSLRHVTVDGIVLRGDEVLLNKRGSYQGRPIHESGKWGLIGGYMDRDETIIQALIREVREESGCEITNIRLFLIRDKPDRPHEDTQNISFVLVADFVSQKAVSTEEVTELKWFPLRKLPPMTEMAFDHGQDLEMLKNYLGDKDRAGTATDIKARFPATIL